MSVAFTDIANIANDTSFLSSNPSDCAVAPRSQCAHCSRHSSERGPFALVDACVLRDGFGTMQQRHLIGMVLRSSNKIFFQEFVPSPTSNIFVIVYTRDVALVFLRSLPNRGGGLCFRRRLSPSPSYSQIQFLQCVCNELVEFGASLVRKKRYFQILAYLNFCLQHSLPWAHAYCHVAKCVYQTMH